MLAGSRRATPRMRVPALAATGPAASPSLFAIKPKALPPCRLSAALYCQGVESKLLVYPDEGHWILKPQNSELWYDTVLEWFDTYLKPKTQSRI